MRSIVEEEKTIIIKYLSEYVNTRCNIQKYDDYIQNNYKDICIENDYNKYLEIANEFYMDEELYNSFKESIINNNISEFIKSNFKKLFFINDDVNSMYHIKMHDGDIDINNIVKNGSLVLSINRKLDYNTDIRERLTKCKMLDKYVKQIEEELSTILYINVKVLYRDTIIPPESLKRI